MASPGPAFSSCYDAFMTVATTPATSLEVEPLTIADRTFRSRLFLGTGKYTDFDTMSAALEASGTEVVTVALRRVNLDERGKGSLLDRIDPQRYLLLPNTAGCYTADEAVRTARLARELGGWSWVKLEVIGDKKTLFPDNVELLRATEILVKEGFTVLPYTNDDPVVCRKLEELGAAAVMPLGAPIGSGMGIRNPANLRIILEQANVPAPRSKKLSWMPIRSSPRTSCQIAATRRSRSFRGTTSSAARLGRSRPGSGRPLRSTLPFGRSGSRSRKTIDEGTMAEGNFSRRKPRTSSPERPPARTT